LAGVREKSFACSSRSSRGGRGGVALEVDRWRKISTSCQAHSKTNEVGLTQVPDPKRASQFSWNWQRIKNS
jgi:hypothetical protein